MSKDIGKISELKIMRSAAGYYLGHEYWDLELEAWLPYSRDSIYYKTRDELERDPTPPSTLPVQGDK